MQNLAATYSNTNEYINSAVGNNTATEHVATSHNKYYVNKYSSHVYDQVIFSSWVWDASSFLHYIEVTDFATYPYLYYSSTIIVTMMTVALVFKNKVFLSLA